MTLINISLICLTLKYISKNYKFICNVSKWIYFELAKLNYTKSKFVKSMKKEDFEVIKILINFNEDIDIINNYLNGYHYSERISENYYDIVKLFIDKESSMNNKTLL